MASMILPDWFRFPPRKYKLVFVVLLVILSVQLLLGYHSNNLDTGSGAGGVADSGGRVLFQHNDAGSLPVDDDDVPSNSNSYSKGNPGGNHQHPKEDFIKSISSNDKVAVENQGKDTKRTNFGDLPFQPKCNVQSKDALSAVNRARTTECKRQILDTVCAIESGTFYADYLTSQCPSGNYTRGRSLGCFQDEQANRLLGGYYVNNKGLNTPKKCIEMCLQSGFMYAGVQYGNECFCGHSQPPSTAKLADSSCNMLCPGSSGDVCGGYFTMNVYETGISSEWAMVIKGSNSVRARL